MMDKEALEKLASLLTGATCTRVEFHAGLPNFIFGSRGLFIWSAWRVVRRGEIIAGSDSGDSTKSKAADVLVGQSARNVSVNGVFHDLRIQFADGVTLETFANMDGREHWQVSGGPDDMLVAGPGQLWSLF